MRKSLFRQMLAILLGMAAASTILFTAGAYLVLDRLYGDENERSFDMAVQALASSFPTDSLGDPAADATWCSAVAGSSGLRVTLVATDGRVLADTMSDPAAMENHGSRPEVAAALQGLTRTAHRSSATLGRELFYAASPVMSGGKPLAVLRIAADLPAIEARLAPARWLLALVTLAVAAAAAAAAALFSRRVSAPIASLAEAARAVAAGDRSRRIPAIAEPREMAVLASGLESMSTELDRRVREAEAEGRERAAILDGMAEAVLALDHGLMLRMANPAARLLFGLGPDESPEGQSLLRSTQSTELEAAAIACLESGMAVERELAIYRGGERWFQAFVAPLEAVARPQGVMAGTSAAGLASGVVIVLNDITRLRRLERVRRDFVANVSHELRTPIQLIKGFAEALLEGAADDPARSERFLGIMQRNATRMENLVGDLLTLARLEQEGRGWLQVEEVGLAGLIEEAKAAVEPKAEERAVSIRAVCADGLKARVNGGLFVQAVVNLLDNAVKYSPASSEVTVLASPLPEPPAGSMSEGPWYKVAVLDHGSGIAAKDLPRIFERFYRVDKARSRELGGTGLGLAIVRHVALAHGGLVFVESYEGEGSTFTICLPVDGQTAAPSGEELGREA